VDTTVNTVVDVIPGLRTNL